MSTGVVPAHAGRQDGRTTSPAMTRGQYRLTVASTGRYAMPTEGKRYVYGLSSPEMARRIDQAYADWLAVSGNR